MESRTTEAFRKLLASAPIAVQTKARTVYRLWSENPAHPSLRFKKVHNTLPIYAVRIDLDWRAVGVLEGGTMVWFWIGPHDEYERLLSKL
ncbi:MAG TPA: hypothetical protein VLF42_01965 [Burkholderiales bacterium]|nr:hypothetical protein [Burkholderiales bacterium]